MRKRSTRGSGRRWINWWTPRAISRPSTGSRAIQKRWSCTKPRKIRTSSSCCSSTAGEFDLIDDNKPFVGAKPIPPGRNLYPEGLTSAQIEAYVKAHPAEKDAIYSPYTVLRWERGKPGAKLEAIPYHVEYKKWLEPAAKSLREAAEAERRPRFRAVSAHARRRAALRRLLSERSEMAGSEESRRST